MLTGQDAGSPGHTGERDALGVDDALDGAAPDPEGTGGVAASHEDGDPAAGVPGSAGKRRPRLSAVLAGVLAVILVAGAVVAGLVWNEGRRDEQRRQLAVTTAQDMAVALVTVNSATAEQDVRKILDGAVGDFGKIFSENLKSYVDIVRRGKVSTSGEVASAGLQKLDGNTARVLVAVKAKVRNKQVPRGEQRTYRMAVEMAEQPDGRWLAKKVEFVP